jgi:hypothetical protein
MNEKFSRYRVIEEDNFYFDMVGKAVDMTDKTLILQFDLVTKLGGIQKVQFYREQLVYVGSF